MSLPPNLYPATPNPVPTDLTQVTPGFRKEVKRVMGSILLFILVYLLLMAASLVLVAACFYLGFQIVINIGGTLGILGGIGLAAVGVMVFIFLVKFIFTVTRVDRSGSVEVTEAEQPELFAFIRQVAADTQAPFPKKIFISSDVNAFVSYDSSFWSMFFPVRKNLTIGLGLVNAVTLSEFKAVMAHEFGHFSQRSMKLGSYVYNVNRILYNMLYENTGYTRMLQGFASVSDVFALFSRLTVQIARGIQMILGSMYGFLNKKYSGLSLQMEFHADAVAASVSGSEALVTALRRLELAGSGLQMSLQQCNNMVADKKRNVNVYPMQSYCMNVIARNNDLPVTDGLPYITDQFLKEQNKRRVNVKDQWASHPETEDRVEALRGYNVVAENNTGSAWKIFREADTLQRSLTKKMYGDIADDNSFSEEDPSFFKNHFEEDIKQNALPESYNGFYSNRVFTNFSMEELAALKPEDLGWENVYSKHFSSLSARLSALTEDITLLQHITENQKAVRSFDFDGQKYAASEAPAIITKLNKEKAALENEIKQADANTIRLALYLAESATGSSREIRDSYTQYFKYREELLATIDRTNEMMGPLQPIFSGVTMGQEDINGIIQKLRVITEPLFKKDIRRWKALGAFDTTNAETQEKIENYLNANYVYFTGTEFMSAELIALHEFASLTIDQADRWVNREFKRMLSR